MRSLPILFLPVMLLLLSNGCVQSLQSLYKTPVARDGNNVQSENSVAPATESSAETVPQNKQPSQSDAPLEADNSAVSEENDIGKFTDHTKRLADQAKSIQPILDEALDFCRVSQELWQKGELESALEALDQAYSLILKIDTFEDPKLIQQKEDLRFMISKRILEIYASRNIVVNGDHNAIPLVMNKHVQAEIDRFTKNNEKSFFIESYKRSGRYRPMIVSALKEAGLPVELSWLPLIESGFKVNALSRARALGLWQFIPSTGYKFGLKRNQFIDERIDPVKATQAAISYLKELHQIFGDWSTVLAGYNCGEGRVLRVIRNQNINYLDNFWDLYERLPLETARYVPRFLATLHIVKNLEKYGFDSLAVDPPWDYEVVLVSKQVHLRAVAKKIGTTEKILKELNPALRYHILPREEYPLRIPPGKGKMLLAQLDKIPVSHPPQLAYIYHRVKRGESLSTIAKKYRTSVNSIARANNIRRKHFIVAGQKLKVPRKGTVVYRSKKYDKPLSHRPTTHIVKSGDSLWIIAKRYGTTTKKIQGLNHLTTTKLSIGQVLKIPGFKGESPSGETLKTYAVKRGDSPFHIAQRHKMSLERFLRINRLTPRSKIYPGQTLYVE